jgi:hypothetical protein
VNEPGTVIDRRESAEGNGDSHSATGKAPGPYPEGNCYCGGPEEIYPHPYGSGRSCRHERPASTRRVLVTVYLVIMDRGGIFGAYLDGDRAHQAAKSTASVVVELPISADYRVAPDRAQGGPSDRA